jgi:hypothetical protein
MNGRFFSGRQISAALHDGKTKYSAKGQARESEQDEAKRLERYSRWLEAGGEGPMPTAETEQEAYADTDDQESGSSSEDEIDLEFDATRSGALFTSSGAKLDKRLIDDGIRSREVEDAYFDEDDELDHATSPNAAHKRPRTDE